MHIAYVSQYFPPEMGAPSARVSELSRAWVRLGHHVTVLTAFPHHPTGVKRPEDRYALRRTEEWEGVRVQRCYVYAAPNKGTAKRMLSYASFMASATVIGATHLTRPDVLIATSPQLLCACAGRALAWRLRVPFVFEVRDLWPESILAVSAMRENLVVRGLRGVAHFLYRSCDRIVTVGNGYARDIQSGYGIPAEKIAVIPNGVDPELYVPGPRQNTVRAEHGWGERFVVLYMGTLGMGHGLRSVLGAAEQLAGDERFLFAFVGEGAEKDALKTFAADRKLRNVQFIDQQPKERVPLYYAACDLGIIALRNTPLFRGVLPSKLFEFMGMERAVVVAVDGDAREVVERAGAGIFVPPEDPEALALAVRELADDEPRRIRMGKAARQYVLAHFNRDILAKTYLDVLAGMVRTAS